jgi:hypothetical protein
MLFVPLLEFAENEGPVLNHATSLRTDGFVHPLDYGVEVVVYLQAA